jgi:hypothetical protein
MACIFQAGTAIKGEFQPEVVAAKGLTSGHYIEILRSGPNLKDYFRRLTIKEQMEMVRTFIPTDLLPCAEKIMQAKLDEGAGQAVTKTKSRRTRKQRGR